MANIAINYFVLNTKSEFVQLESGKILRSSLR